MITASSVIFDRFDPIVLVLVLVLVHICTRGGISQDLPLKHYETTYVMRDQEGGAPMERCIYLLSSLFFMMVFFVDYNTTTLQIINRRNKYKIQNTFVRGVPRRSLCDAVHHVVSNNYWSISWMHEGKKHLKPFITTRTIDIITAKILWNSIVGRGTGILDCYGRTI